MSDAIDLASLHPLEVKLLRALDGHPEPFAESPALASRAGLDEAQLRSAVGWLAARGVLAQASETASDEVSLGDLGEAAIKDGLPELVIHQRLTHAPIPMKELKAAFAPLPEDVVGTAFGALKKAGAVTVDKGAATAVPGADLGPFKALLHLLKHVAHLGTAEVAGLPEGDRALVEAHGRRRGGTGALLRLATRTTRTYSVAKPDWIRAVLAAGATGDEVSALTPEMLQDGSWKTRKFRAYNLGIAPTRVYPGRLHPYMEFLDALRTQLLSMGFTEMEGGLVENEFWNNDALFMPQFHSARDIHDVYFVKDPTHARKLEEPYGSQVAATHEKGWKTGSRGWAYKFDLERTKRLILRSQGTALSSRQLAKGAEVPGKYFAIARCFRYDQVDATHLSDFYQVEGIVLGHDIAFTHLLGLLDLFAKEVAKAHETFFAPAYFPFTEPSVELHARHPAIGWMELGGAGLFRPEVTRPLGVDVPVIAWGLGVDRMAMVALGVNDIRDLFSFDLDYVRRMGGVIGDRAAGKGA